MLSQSERLDDEALIETARNKSQAHLMAISIRKVLSGAVTDVLVLRGNDEVIQSTVNNPGAEFSERGFTRLVSRAERDDDLATCLGMRPTIPRHLYLKLLAKASVTVRERLEAANPQQARDVPTAVREATRLARVAPSAITRDTAIAHALVKSLYEDGRLDEFQVAAFAEAGKFDEANAAIAALANVPVSIAENMMVETRSEGVMILAKVSGMSWSTVKAIINMRDDLSGMEPTDLDGLQGHLRTAAALDRAAGAAFPPHAAERGAGGVSGNNRHRPEVRRDENQNRSTLDPASAPMAATSAVAMLYQVATNSGESSVQCEAYSVAARPADNSPAMAPATAGRVGAPWRKPNSAAASSGSDISGMVVRQVDVFLPIIRVMAGSRCGIIISPPIPATKSPTGISSSHAQPRSEASGRDKCRLTAMAEIASASVTANFRSKNGSRIAVMTSGLTPSSAKNIAAETGAAASSASISTNPTGRARWLLSAARVRMS